MKARVKVTLENEYEVELGKLLSDDPVEPSLVEHFVKKQLTSDPGLYSIFGGGIDVDPKDPKKVMSYGITRKKSTILRIEIPLQMKVKKSKKNG